MSPTPKRYRFDNEVPSFEPRPLPAQRPEATMGQSPMQVPADLEPHSVRYSPRADVQPQVVNVYQAAPPDRTVQRLALGAGVGGGAVAAAVYFGPMLTAALTFMTIWLGILALVIAVISVSVVMVVRSVKAEPATRKRRR